MYSARSTSAVWRRFRNRRRLMLPRQLSPEYRLVSRLASNWAVIMILPQNDCIINISTEVADLTIPLMKPE